MRLVSLNARKAQDAAMSPEVEVALIEISHPDLEAPIRLSSDSTVRLSSDPLSYGTRSNWRGADPETEPFLFVLISTVLPGEAEDAPASAQLVLQALDARMAEVLRAVTTPAEVALAVVLAGTPDVIEQEWTGLQLTGAEGGAATVTLSLSREEIELEPFPSTRMTRRNFPGLFV